MKLGEWACIGAFACVSAAAPAPEGRGVYASCRATERLGVCLWQVPLPAFSCKCDKVNSCEGAAAAFVHWKQQSSI